MSFIINPYVYDAQALIGPNTGLNLATHHLKTMMKEGDIPITDVAADGDAVGLIYDQTINGLIWRNATAGTIPILGSDGTRNSYLTFDGTNDRQIAQSSLSFFNTFWQAVPKGTILIWFKMNGGDGVSQYLFNNTNLTTVAGLQIFRANTNKILARGGDGTLRWTITSTDDVTTADGWVGMIVSCNGVGASAGRFILMDSAGTIFNDQTFSVAAGSTVNAQDQAMIGARVGTPDLFLNGDISALIVENFPVSDALIEQFRNYNPARITTEFSPIAQWLLDMNNSAFIFSNSALTTPVVADDVVRGMRQQIIGNFNTTPSFGALRRQFLSASDAASAIYKVNVINGNNVIRFDGTDDTYTLSGVPIELFEERAGKWTFFAVLKNNDTTNGSHFLSGNNYMVLSGSSYAGESPPTTVNPYSVVHPDPVGTSIHTNTKGAGVDGFKVVAFMRNGSALASWNGDKTKNTSTSSSVFYISNMGVAHAGVGASWNMHGDIAYIIKFNGVMTDAEVEAFIDNLNSRFAL